MKEEVNEKMKSKGQLEKEKKKEKRVKNVMVRFSESEFKMVNEKACQSGLRLAEYCRNILLLGNVTVRQNKRIELDETVMINLYRIGSNLNQLVKHLNIAKEQYVTYEEVLTALAYIIEIRDIYKQILNKLKEVKE